MLGHYTRPRPRLVPSTNTSAFPLATACGSGRPQAQTRPEAVWSQRYGLGEVKQSFDLFAIDSQQERALL